MYSFSSGFPSGAQTVDQQPRLLPRLLTILRQPVEAGRRWRERARARAELVSLDDRTLSDIGLTRADVERRLLEL